MEENLGEKLCQLGQRILETARNELYVHMRFMDVALSSLGYVMDPSIQSVGTDGLHMFYHPAALGKAYQRNPIWVNRTYLHVVLHCILYHVTRRRQRDEALWNLACDIAVESIVDHWYLKCIHQPQTRLRKDVYHQLEQKMKVLTAERVYHQLVKWDLSEERQQQLSLIHI